MKKKLIINIYNIFKRVLQVVVVASIIVGLFTIPDIVYSYWNEYYLFTPTYREFQRLFLLALLISFLPYKQKVVALYIVYILVFFQLSSYSYFGKLISPFDIWLFFSHFFEVTDGLQDEYKSLFIPFLVASGSLIISLLVVRNIDKYSFKFNYSFVLLFIGLLVAPYKIYNTVYVKKEDSLDKYPQTLSTSFRNIYKSINYFSVVTLPRKLSSTHKEKIFIDQKVMLPNPKHNIILILGESFRAQNASILECKVKTMPKLQELQNSGDISSKLCVSAGTMTKVSIAYLFNQVSNMDDISKLYSPNFCLFKLAKENGFDTVFTTNQSEDESKYIHSFICPKYIDTFETPTTFLDTDDVTTTLSDSYMTEKLKNVNLSKPTFLVMQMQGSHAPYSLKSSEEFKKFDSEYDNSIYYTDYVLSNLVKDIKNRKNILPTYLVFVSDHGEMLGERGKNGHGHLEKEVFSVPFIYFNTKKDKKVDEFFQKQKVITHFDISQVIVNFLGYESNLTVENEKDVLVMGKDVDGYAGYTFVKIKNDEIVSTDTHK